MVDRGDDNEVGEDGVISKSGSAEAYDIAPI